MKKILSVFLFFLYCLTIPLSAAEKEKKIALIADLHYFLQNTMMIHGDIGFLSWLSFQPDISYMHYEAGDDVYSMNGFGGGLRFYWEGRSVNGYYVGFVLNHYTFDIDINHKDGVTDKTLKGTSSGDGFCYDILVGYQSIWDNGVVLDLAFRVQFMYTKDKNTTLAGDGLEREYTVNGLSIFRAGVKIGLGFAI